MPVPSRRRLSTMVGLLTLAAALVPSMSTAPALATPPAHRPVIFVHGWTGNTAAFDNMVNDFVGRGYAPGELFRFAYNSTTQSNVVTAQLFNTYVDQVLATTGAMKVDIVAHSMGGLNTRYCIKYEGCAGKVDHWVALASPAHGTSAGLVCALIMTACWQMVPGSNFLNTLNAAPETTVGVKWFTLRSAGNDGVVYPTESAVLAGAVNTTVDASLRHNEIPKDPGVIAQVYGILTTT